MALSFISNSSSHACQKSSQTLRMLKISEAHKKLLKKPSRSSKAISVKFVPQNFDSPSF